MKTLEVRYSTLRLGFLLFGLLFYLKAFDFLMVLALGRSSSIMDRDLEGNVVNQVCGLITLLIPAWLFVRQRVFQRRSLYRDNLAMLLFLACLLLSVFWSHEPALSLRRFVALLGVVAFAGFALYNYSLERLALLIGCTIGFLSLLGLLLALVVPELVFYDQGARAGAFRGLFGEKNAAARLNAVALLLLLPAIRQRHRWALVAGACALLAVALSRSATGVVLLCVGLTSYAYFLMLIRLRLHRSRTTLVLSTLIYLAICLTLYANYHLFLDLLGRDSTLTDRTQIWALLEAPIQAEWLRGYGFGAFWASPAADFFLRRWGYIGNAHSGYLETLLHGGVIQLAALLMLFAATLRKHFSALRGRVAVDWHACALIITGLFILANYVAYVVPNYRSGEFLVFCVLALTLRSPARSAAAVRGLRQGGGIHWRPSP